MYYSLVQNNAIFNSDWYRLTPFSNGIFTSTTFSSLIPKTTPLFRTPAVRRSLFDPDSAVHSTPGVEDFPSRLDQDLDAERQFLEEGSDVISEIENLDLASVLMNALLLSALCLGPQQERDPQLNL